ncbi:MAG: hypothetical protein AAB605_03480 [Patescibacteria group bacterium]
MSIFQFERILSVGLVVVVVLVAAAGGYLWYVESQGNPLEAASRQANTSEATVLEGTYVCLPHTDGSKAKECTPGIKVGDEHYALDMAAVIEGGSTLTLTNGMKILAGGIVVPIEETSSDQWQNYPVRGIMKVEEVAKQ